MALPRRGPPCLARQLAPGLGDLSLADVIGRIEREVAGRSNAVMIGHSVGGLITQIMLNRGAIAVGVAIDPLRRTP